MKKFHVHTLADLEPIVDYILEDLKDHRIFALTGNLGAGKTSLVQQIGKKLGSKSDITSPTYALINEYTSESGPIFHMDLYRLNDVEEIWDLGFDEYISSGHYCFIEWPEIAVDLFPENYKKIDIQLQEDSSRIVIIL